MKLPTTVMDKSNLRVSRLGLGGAPLGEMFERLPEARAQAVVQTAYERGITLFDTAPWYGHGMSEHRLGHYLRQCPRDSFVLSTKVGRLYRSNGDPDFRTPPWIGGLPFELHFDYSYEGIMRSWQDSLMRLGLNRVEMLVIHDLDSGYHDSAALAGHQRELKAGGFQALQELRSSGRIQAIGAGINDESMVPYFLANFDLDFLLVAMPYTLLDQGPLQGAFQACADRGVAVIIGSPYASGILATGAVEGALYNYAPAGEAVLEKVRTLDSVCQRHNTSLAAAALQFCLAHPLVAAAIPGAIQPRFVLANIENLTADIPAALWAELKDLELIAPAAPVPLAAS